MKIPTSNKWKEIQEREQEEQKLKEFYDNEVKERLRRKFDYSKVVKNEYWPEVSEKKKQELEDIKKKLVTGSVKNSSKALTTRKSYSMLTGSTKEDAIHSESITSNKTPLKQYYRYRPKKRREKLLQETPTSIHTQRVEETYQKK